MSRGELIRDRYFEWMVDVISNGRFADTISYRSLLEKLHRTTFRWRYERDGDRAKDGELLRYRFAYYHSEFSDAENYITEPCSVLEMMVALAIRCEESIMTNTLIGDRTGQWFWSMITSLGLGQFTDDRYDDCLVNDILIKFLRREYEIDGHGGLFTVKNRNVDMRRVEIWYQCMYYLDSLI